MTIEFEILQRWSNEKRDYDDWGKFVKETIFKALSVEMEAPDLFLRVPVKHRLKDDASLIQKALYRGKKYKKPYEDIEDKVGIRFVVLTSEEIPIIEKIITNSCDKFWFWEKARDFLDERACKPWEFGYQSVHYIIRSKAGVSLEGKQIQEDIPCEIQIRTLLQHAFSELTHDTIYKPSVKSTPEMMRAAAKSMALIEATDDYFCQVGKLIDASVKKVKDFIDVLAGHYSETIGVKPKVTRFDGELIDAYLPIISENSPQTIIEWLNTKKFIEKRIAERRESQSLYSLLAIFLIYFVVGKFPSVAPSPEILTDEELGPIYSDLGLSISR